MTTTNTAAASGAAKHYAERDHEAQGAYYTSHVSAMTGEGLHAKSDIAAELAHRDIEIDRLRAALAAPAQAVPAQAGEYESLAQTWELNASEYKERQCGVSADYNKGIAEAMHACAQELRAARGAAQAAPVDADVQAKAAPSGPALEPLKDHKAYALIDSMKWPLDDSEKDDMLKLLRAVEAAHGITAAPKGAQSCSNA